MTCNRKKHKIIKVGDFTIILVIVFCLYSLGLVVEGRRRRAEQGEGAAPYRLPHD